VSETLLWVYGIVPAAFDAPPGEGVDGRPVSPHRHDNLTALVSELPRERFDEEALRARLEDMEDLEGLARAHEDVLQQALRAGTVVPFRLCTIYASPERLDAMLDREGAALAAALSRLDGMQEWGVKAFLRAPQAVSAAAAPATGTEYLSRLRDKRDAADEGETVVAEVHARLTDGAAAAALSRPQDRRLSGRDAEMVLNGAYLVPGDGVDRFRSLVEELSRRHEPDGVELELTGPWPPHHFVATPEQ
jgi:Gas vesicle synthesis protein GvpL/GvpF